MLTRVEIIPFQTELRPALPNIYGSKDYREFREILIKIDTILVHTDFESRLISTKLHNVAHQQKSPTTWLNSAAAQYHYRTLKHAMRCNIARSLTGESSRRFSAHLADSTLLQWFTGISDFGACKASSKSALDRYQNAFDAELLIKEIHALLNQFTSQEMVNAVGISEPLCFDAIWTDSTCVKANIHFPVDWVLLTDACKTLILSINTIRRHGLKHRMNDPHEFLKKINQLSIKMTHTRRKKDSKKQRKKILRDIKSLTRVIERHALRYRNILASNWSQTDLTEAQQQQVISRIDSIITQLPNAIHQAHERIIGERQLPSKEKLISLYDRSAQIIVRGKSGNEVEFGQRLFITEQRNGLIIDWEMQGKESQSDAKMLETIVKRVTQNYETLSSVGGDRGFNSTANTHFLNSQNIYDGTCPRSVTQLQERLNDPVFVEQQTRRSQTEGRIGLFKNVFLGKPLRSQVLSNKQQMLNWCVLTHNLWVLARMALTDEMLRATKAA
jgi:hypothetical protein